MKDNKGYKGDQGKRDEEEIQFLLSPFVSS